MGQCWCASVSSICQNGDKNSADCLVCDAVMSTKSMARKLSRHYIGSSSHHHRDVRAARGRLLPHVLAWADTPCLGEGAHPQGSREAGHCPAVCLWGSPETGHRAESPHGVPC